MIEKSGKQLPVKVSTMRLWVRTSRRRVHLIPTNYPMLRVPDWVHCIFRHGGHFFMGGRTMDDLPAFQSELVQFWQNYRSVDPGFAFFQTNPETAYPYCIPIAIHGDEGRGKAKNPIMVISVQPVLPLLGEKTNMQGHLGCNSLTTNESVIVLSRFGWFVGSKQMIFALDAPCRSGQLSALGCSSQFCLRRTPRRTWTSCCQSWRWIWNPWTKMEWRFLNWFSPSYILACVRYQKHHSY